MVFYVAWKIIRVRKTRNAPYPFRHCSLLDTKSSSSGIVVRPKIRQVIAVCCKTTERRFIRWSTQLKLLLC
uniref:Uncharacterized protein n=1 Tax=Arundo donax TaxID=35708 RepID=A0A0A9EHC5_ARUDO